MAQAAKTLVREPEPPAPSPEAALAAVTAEIGPIQERLKVVAGELASLEGVGTGPDLPLGDALKARREAEAKRRDLQLEQGLLTERLAPLRQQAEALAVEVEAAARAAERAKAIADGLAALARVTAAREALVVEVEALRAVADDSAVSWQNCPELHFAVQRELGDWGRVSNRLRGASR